MKNQPLVHFIEWKKIGDEELEKTLNEVRSWGVTDIVAHPVWGEPKGRLKEIARMIASADLRTPACHAFWGKYFDLGCTDETLRAESMKAHRDFLYELAPMGVKTYTLHLGIGKNSDSDFVWGQIRKSVEELLPAAEETSIILALENGCESLENLRRLVAFAKEYNHPQIGFCFDTGHANCYSELGLFPTLELMKSDIVTCHMHDNHGSFDDHNPPGGGNMDWGKLIPALKSCPRLLHAETESGNWSEASWNQFLKVMPPEGR